MLAMEEDAYSAILGTYFSTDGLVIYEIWKVK